MRKDINVSKKTSLFEVYLGQPIKAAVVASLLAVSASSSGEVDFGEPVTFERAYRIALERSPRAQLLEAQLEALEGRIEQAGLAPNPTVGADLENVLGTGGFEGVDRMELTIGISQVLERGEKRRRRAALAEKGKALFRWKYEEERAALRHEVRRGFLRALIAQQNVALQEDLLELAQSSESEVRRRAEVATASSVELSQARLATRRQAFERDRARLGLQQARTALAALWNEPQAGAFELVGSLDLDTNLPDLSELSSLIDTAPSVARFQAEKESQEAVVELERAEAKGDVELFGGVKYLREGSGDAAFVVGFEVPWRIRNRNQGNIRAAIAGLSVVESQRQLARRDALASLTVSYGELRGALDEWIGLKEQLLPSAQDALAETQEGYEQGMITLLNVLDARRALFEIRAEMLDATGRYLDAQATIERLTRSSENL